MSFPCLRDLHRIQLPSEDMQRVLTNLFTVLQSDGVTYVFDFRKVNGLHFSHDNGCLGHQCSIRNSEFVFIVFV
mgnify:CR=1 FL=1